MRGRTTAARRDGRATIRARVLTAAAIACGALVCAPVAAVALTPQQAVDALNARRAAHGIPAGVTQLELLSAGCAMHVNYMALNGHTLTHAEVATQPGFTLQGARVGVEFSASEVLAKFGKWSATGTPWDVSPSHLYLMMSPGMRQAGYFEAYGLQCMRFRYHDDAFTAGPPTFYSVPGNGRTDVPRSQVAQSATGVPQTHVGIPAGQATGPNILLYATGLGTGLRPAQATLTGPNGPVEVRVVDEAAGGAIYAGGGVMIPVKPLEPGTYSARVVWQNPSGVSASHQFFFTTEGATAPPTPPAPVVRPSAPAGATPDKPKADQPAAVAPDRPVDPRLVPRDQDPSTIPTLPLGERPARSVARSLPSALRRVRVARVDGTPAAMLWLRRAATVTIRVETRSGRLVRRVEPRRVKAGAAAVVLGRLPGGRYALEVTVKERAGGTSATTRNFRLAG